MSDRKLDHIQLTNSSQAIGAPISDLFYYEPLLSSHREDIDLSVEFLGKKLKLPLWISSMTGGTGAARHINNNLSKVAGKMGIGMGLGSCRPLLDSNEFLDDFNLKHNLGDYPFWANLGVAQVQECLDRGQKEQVIDIINKTNADGLIIHVNPLQEWMQPEGDQFTTAPINTIKDSLDVFDFPIIVKEVGQGMGIESLKSLMELPLSAIEFAAYGGTNFTTLEKSRAKGIDEIHTCITSVGHTALDMVEMSNQLINENKHLACQNFIISGGIRDYLTGYYLMEKSLGNCVFGMASPFLEKADLGEKELLDFVLDIEKGLKLASQFLRIRN